jgi:hypothetical protein
MIHEKPKCPKCGSDKLASLLYGLPIEDDYLHERVRRREVILMGCTVGPDDPQLQCLECDYQFSIKHE